MVKLRLSKLLILAIFTNLLLLQACAKSPKKVTETNNDDFLGLLVPLAPEKKIRAISYSGFRQGQGPGWRDPSYEQVKEDLQLLARHWNYIRMYGSGSHTETVLEVIRNEKLPINVMLGAWLAAEVNNPHNPWGATYTEEELRRLKIANREEIDRAIKLIGKYPDIITAVSVGNEALVDWTDHLVPLESMLEYVRTVKAAVDIPITVAENYVPWQNGLEELVELLDFITIHSYPIWEGKPIEEGLSFTIENYEAVAKRHPNKILAFGEIGWTTTADGAQIPVANANEENQKRYFEEVSRWTEENNILSFFFSAFDEDWKGGPSPNEPEKHWGLFTIDRKPKAAIKHLYPDL